MNKKEQKKILSIISPVYNEAENLVEFYSRVINATDNQNLEIEIIYINDGSQDSTIDIITKQRQTDNRITVIDLSRNFGKEIALTAGLDYSSGDATIVIDAERMRRCTCAYHLRCRVPPEYAHFRPLYVAAAALSTLPGGRSWSATPRSEILRASTSC